MRSIGMNGEVFGSTYENCAAKRVRNGKDRLSCPTGPFLDGGSRVSMTSSLWGSLRTSMRTLSKAAVDVILVAPCSRNRCCIGCVSLRDAVALICVAELVVIALSSLIAVDIYLTDGRMFYTKEMEGQGATVAIGFCVFLLISVPIIVLTLVSWHFRKPTLYIVHVFWQWTMLEALLFFSYGALKRAFSSELRQRTGFLLPSAVLLSIVGVTGVVVQSWWTFVFVYAMFFEMSGSSTRRKRSVCSKDGENEDEESVSTDSGNHSFRIPIVKVEHTNSLDVQSIGDTRLVTTARMNEIAELTDVVIV